MKKVMTFGTFDSLHPGHFSYLLSAKQHGDYLVIVLARDETIKELKGKKPKYSLKERKQHLEITGIPDKVVSGYAGDKYKIVEKLQPDIICLGYDQTHFTEHLKEELKKRKLKTKVVRLKPYKEHIFKSSKLK